MATQRPPWLRMPTMRPTAPAPAPPRPPALVRPAPPSQPPTPKPSSPPPQPSTPPPSKPTSPVTTTDSSPPPPPSPSSPAAPRASPPRTPAAAPSSPLLTNANIQQQSPSSEIKTAQSKSPANNINNVKQTTPISSPKTLQAPPSPLQLPSPQIKTRPEIHQKSVVVPENIEKPPTKTNNVHIHKGKREPPPPPPSPTKDKDTIKKVVSESEDLGMRIITIAGDNRGALMEISSSKGKTNPASRGIGRGRGRGRGYTLGNKSGEQGKSDDDHEKEQNGWQPMTTFLNSNVQGLNNSIVFNTNCHHNNPGIHLSLIRRNLNANG